MITKSFKSGPLQYAKLSFAVAGLPERYFYVTTQGKPMKLSGAVGQSNYYKHMLIFPQHFKIIEKSFVSRSLSKALHLSHNNPCFQCNIVIMNFLVSNTCEIRFHDVMDRTVRMFTS